MKCPEVTRQLAEYQVGGLSPWVRARVRRHLAGAGPVVPKRPVLARTGELLSGLTLEPSLDYGWAAVRASILS